MDLSLERLKPEKVQVKKVRNKKNNKENKLIEIHFIIFF